MKNEADCQDKVLIINLASCDSGFEYLEHPIEHTLTFYLINKKLININHFNFGIDYYPSFTDFEESTYVKSNELDRELRELVASNFLEISRSSIPKFKLTKNTLAIKQKLINNWTKENYDNLKRTIKDALKNKRDFLEECYRAYLKSI
ncbi:MAG: hypothetical protein ACTSVV_03445 [Promethearchaeota archaeon]